MNPPNHSRCLECEEILLSQVSDERPVQLLEIPHSALAGLPEGRNSFDVTRRRLLQAGVAGLASVYGPKALGWESVWESAVAQADTGNCLVLVYIAGGNDGLNTLIPAGSTDYGKYVGARPVLHRGQGATANGLVGSRPVPNTSGTTPLAFANPLVSTGGGGDNSFAIGLDTLYGNGKGISSDNLALMPAVDYTPPNLSHFESSDYWFAGALQQLSTGWLGRWLDTNGSQTNPLQAISINSSISKAIRTSTAPVCAIPNTYNLGFSFSGTGGTGLQGTNYAVPNANTPLNALGGVPASAGNTHLARSRQTYQESVSVFQDTGSLPTLSPAAPYPTLSSDTQLVTQFQLAATLLAAGLGTRIITISWGGFDTHGNQIATQDPQLATLSRCLAAFQQDLQNKGVASKVSTLVFSEFGRRVAENGSHGTDHGAGGLMLAMGQKVRGGLAAPFPGLSTLDATGDLVVSTDFRSVYQAVISEWLGTDPGQVLPGSPAGGFAALQRPDGSGNTLFDVNK
ncbi:MAG: DUF1501 domain-containing protein [Actinomycetota bacterium]|nr:DUF1501 domain-containing protein [Actinomycetota bacterium]